MKSKMRKRWLQLIIISASASFNRTDVKKGHKRSSPQGTMGPPKKSGFCSTDTNSAAMRQLNPGVGNKFL